MEVTAVGGGATMTGSFNVQLNISFISETFKKCKDEQIRPSISYGS